MCQTFGKKKNNINTIVKGSIFIGNCGKARKLAKKISNVYITVMTELVEMLA